MRLLGLKVWPGNGQPASHNLNLRMMAFSHLKETFWAADMKHNHFTEGLKVFDASATCTRQDHPADKVQANLSSMSGPSQQRVTNNDISVMIPPTEELFLRLTWTK